MVCFSPSKRLKLEQASVKKSPVKLTSVKKSFSRIKAFEQEIIVNDTAEVVEEVDYPFIAIPVPTTMDSPHTNVTALQELPDRDKVSLHLYIKVTASSFLLHPKK